MDKAFMKLAFKARGLPVPEYRVLRLSEWRIDRDRLIDAIPSLLGFPVFVKPANLGSSVGISKAKTSGQLATAIDLAFEFDLKVVVEAAVPAAREIEVGVLGNDDVEASVAGEVVPDREFYDYEAKYLDSASTVHIPAALDETQHAEIRRLAIQAFQAVDGAGMARVDFLLSRETGTLYVNEVNTIPGFTTISMFSKLWAATGVDYPALLDRLIRLALERHAEKQRLKTSAL
jgi:D-alanine-D-alanine ligase